MNPKWTPSLFETSQKGNNKITPTNNKQQTTESCPANSSTHPSCIARGRSTSKLPHPLISSHILHRQKIAASIMMLDGTEDEEKFLAAGIAGLQQNAFYMHRALVIPPNPNSPSDFAFSKFNHSELFKLIQFVVFSLRIRTISEML